MYLPGYRVTEKEIFHLLAHFPNGAGPRWGQEPAVSESPTWETSQKLSGKQRRKQDLIPSSLTSNVGVPSSGFLYCATTLDSHFMLLKEYKMKSIWT